MGGREGFARRRRMRCWSGRPTAPPMPRNMKECHSPDPELSRLLRAWTIEPAPPPGFASGVWRRIETRAAARPAPAWRGMLTAVLHALRQPAFATAWIALLLLAGAGTGIVQGQRTAESLHVQMQGRYVQSIDPFASAIDPERGP